MIDTGQVYHATLTLRGQSIAPSTATLVITLPDGTVVPGTTPGAGTAAGPDWVITYDYATTVPGLHKVSWQTTGPGTAAVDYFNVRAFSSILSLAEAKLHLSAGPGSTWTSDDDELRNFLQAVTEVVEAKVGPCVRRTTTQRVAGYSAAAIVLNQAPVITVTSVTSVWSGGPAWTTPQLIVDGDAGIVSVQFGAPPFWYGPWDVAYVSGRAVVPERFQHAAKELLRHLWDSQRGQLAAAPLGGETFTTTTGWAFSVPNRVVELLADDMTPAI